MTRTILPLTTRQKRTAESTATASSSALLPRRISLRRREKTLEGEGCLLKEASLSPQTSHSLRELPPRAPALTWQRVVSLCMMRVLSGEVFCRFGEVEIFCGVRLRTRFVCGMRFVVDALHVCRDPACRRPFGVRLRGVFRLYRSPLQGNAAPLRMTQRGGVP